MTFSDKLHELKERSELSLAAIAEASGVPRATLNNYFIGRSDPSGFNLIRLCKVFNIAAEEFERCTSSKSQYKARAAAHAEGVQKRKRIRK